MGGVYKTENMNFIQYELCTSNVENIFLPIFNVKDLPCLRYNVLLTIGKDAVLPIYIISHKEIQESDSFPKCVIFALKNIELCISSAQSYILAIITAPLLLILSVIEKSAPL